MYHLSQNGLESIVEASLFQAELVFRALNTKLTGHPVYDGSTIPQLVAKLFGEIEPNWTKEESRLIMLLFTGFRNTIHTGRIYFKNMTGITKQYGGHNYQFTYGQPPTLPPGITLLDLGSDLMDVMKSLFDSELIEAIGPLAPPITTLLGIKMIQKL